MNRWTVCFRSLVLPWTQHPALLRPCCHSFNVFFFVGFLFVSRYFNQCTDNDVHTKIKCINLQTWKEAKNSISGIDGSKMLHFRVWDAMRRKQLRTSFRHIVDKFHLTRSPCPVPPASLFSLVHAFSCYPGTCFPPAYNSFNTPRYVCVHCKTCNTYSHAPNDRLFYGIIRCRKCTTQNSILEFEYTRKLHLIPPSASDPLSPPSRPPVSHGQRIETLQNNFPNQMQFSSSHEYTKHM